MSNPNPEVNGEGQQQTAARAPTPEALSAPCTALHRIDSFDAAQLIFFTCKSSPFIFFNPFSSNLEFFHLASKRTNGKPPSRRSASRPSGFIPRSLLPPGDPSVELQLLGAERAAQRMRTKAKMASQSSDRSAQLIRQSLWLISPPRDSTHAPEYSHLIGLA